MTAALSTMLAAGDQISYTSVARRAGVSTWLPLTLPVSGSRSTLRSHSKPTTTNVKRHRNPAAPCGPTSNSLGKRSAGYAANETNYAAICRTPWDSATNLTSAPLVERIATLSQELTQTRQANSNLTDAVTALQDNLDASRRALRQMIKNTAAADATLS